MSSRLSVLQRVQCRSPVGVSGVWAAQNGLTRLTIPHRPAHSTPTLGQEQRLAWLRRVLTEPLEATPYRLAAALLLLYAQPFTRIAALCVDDITDTIDAMTIRLGGDPAPVPQPFAALVRQHLASRPNLRHTGQNSPWLFASITPGRHLTADAIMQRVRDLGIDLRGARNQVLHDLVTQAPAPVVAAMLGYSNQVTAQHAAHAATPTASYASLRAIPSRNPQPADKARARSPRSEVQVDAGVRR